MASADSDPPPPRVVEECRGVLRVLSDGSIARSPNPSFSVPVLDDGSVAWKDAVFDPAHDLRLRLYTPLAAGPNLPVLVYFHGGGFCIGSRTWPNFHNYCLRLAADLPALILAPDYRLAPEHRLPAALHDSASALLWLRTPDPWLAAADLSRVVVAGDSAGGNIAHHLSVRFGSTGGRVELDPVRIRGYVLLMPFFGGTVRTPSEAGCPEEAFLNLELNDRYWRLSLPAGATVDHPVANPFGPESPALGPVEMEPVLVVVGERDLLRDRAVEYARRLREMGKPAEVAEFAGQQHGFFTLDPWSEPAEELMRLLRRFMGGCGRRPS